MEKSLKSALEKGVSAHRAGKLKEAKKFYNTVLEAQPKNPDANHNMGILKIGLGKPQAALSFLKTALEADASSGQFWVSYIDTLIKLNKFEEAKSLINKAKKFGAHGSKFDEFEERLGNTNITSSSNKKIRIDPPQNLLNEISNLYSQSKFKAAQDKVSELLEKFPYSAMLHNIRGGVSVKQGQLELAELSYRNAIELKPKFTDAHNNLGNLFRLQGQLTEAIVAYNIAIEIDSQYAQAYFNKGNALRDQGKLTEALEAFKKAVKIDAKFVNAFNNLGNVLKELGHVEQAIEAYNKALVIKPDYVKAYNNLAELLLAEGHYERSAKCYEKAIELYENNSESQKQAQSMLLKVLYSCNDQTRFRKHLTKIVKLGLCNAIIGSYVCRAELNYGLKTDNPYCASPINYVVDKSLLNICDFEKYFVKKAKDILYTNSVSAKKQPLLVNGQQTSGNIFASNDYFDSAVTKIIATEVEKYRNSFKHSTDGLISSWPSNYTIYGWLVSMKTGGAIRPHMHEQGWLSGSIYIHVPEPKKNDNGNLVVCIDSTRSETKKIIDVKTGSLCLFPSSLLHYTIPFESKQDRIVLAFDIVPNV